MQLYVPRVGEKIRLLENWNCSVFSEYRNEKIFQALGINTSGTVEGTAIRIMLPEQTVLKIDRLYIRAPASSFDSITFSIQSCPVKALEKARFWVKIAEANKIQFEHYIIDKSQVCTLDELMHWEAEKDGIDLINATEEEKENIIGNILTEYPACYKLALTLDDSVIERMIRIHTRRPTDELYGKAKDFAHNRNITLKLTLYPVFDGLIYKPESNEVIDYLSGAIKDTLTPWQKEQFDLGFETAFYLFYAKDLKNYSGLSIFQPGHLTNEAGEVIPLASNDLKTLKKAMTVKPLRAKKTSRKGATNE